MNIIVGQSGGPTAVINASLYGVLQGGLNRNEVDKVYGMVNGIEGFLEDRFVNLSVLTAKELQLLRNTPASYLGSCRFKLPENLSDPVYDEIFRKLKANDIREFYYIGGNDSMDTILKLSSYGRKTCSPIKFIGVPKTIDNDLCGMDHTPGYGSVAKYIGATVRNIVWDAGVYQHPVVTIIELMGRHAGWITAAAALARTSYEPNPLLIYLPEVPFSTEKFIQDVKAALKGHNSVVVCVSEGIKNEEGKLIADSGLLDNFGHTMLSGSGKILEDLVKKEIGCKCRSIEVNLIQRCSNILQSMTDRNEAEEAGRYAVTSAESGTVVCLNRTNEYRIEYCMRNVEEIANKEKTIPTEWIVNGNDISEDFLRYVRPLIEGEVNPVYEDGLPVLLQPVYR